MSIAPHPSNWLPHLGKPEVLPNIAKCYGGRTKSSPVETYAFWIEGPGGLPWWLSGKESACIAGDEGDAGSIPWLWRSLKEGRQGNPLQYSCLENSMDRGPWRVTVHKIAKSQTWLSTHVCSVWECFEYCTSKNVSIITSSKHMGKWIEWQMW